LFFISIFSLHNECFYLFFTSSNTSSLDYNMQLYFARNHMSCQWTHPLAVGVNWAVIWTNRDGIGPSSWLNVGANESAMKWKYTHSQTHSCYIYNIFEAFHHITWQWEEVNYQSSFCKWVSAADAVAASLLQCPAQRNQIRSTHTTHTHVRPQCRREESVLAWLAGWLGWVCINK